MAGAEGTLTAKEGLWGPCVGRVRGRACALAAMTVGARPLAARRRPTTVIIAKLWNVSAPEASEATLLPIALQGCWRLQANGSTHESLTEVTEATRLITITAFCKIYVPLEHILAPWRDGSYLPESPKKTGRRGGA